MPKVFRKICSVKDCFITSLSLLCDLFSVYKKKRPLRFHAAKQKPTHKSFRTGGGYEESPFSPFTKRSFRFSMKETCMELGF